MMGRLGWSRADSITFALRCQHVARTVFIRFLARHGGGDLWEIGSGGDGFTPGRAKARVASIWLILACGCGPLTPVGRGGLEWLVSVLGSSSTIPADVRHQRSCKWGVLKFQLSVE